MLESISEHLSPEFLDDHIEKIVLEVFGDPADDGHRDGADQDIPDARIVPVETIEIFIVTERYSLRLRLLVTVGQVHQFTKKDGIDEGEAGVHGRQEHGQEHQPFIGFEVIDQDFHGDEVRI